MGAIFENPSLLLWLILMLVFIVVEATSAALISIWFAAGSLAAMVIAALGLPVWLQILVFIAVSGIVLLMAKPLISRHINQKAEKTNADRVIDAVGLVKTDINPIASAGQVEVMGQLWSARSVNQLPIPAGSQVRVVAIEGAKLLVEPHAEQIKEEEA